MFKPSDYTEAFDREHGFTPAQWLYSLPGAVRAHRLQLGPEPGQALVRIGTGALQMRWTTLPPRAIALMRMPRLQVQYRFSGVTPEARAEFMRYFDLFIQRGGG